MGLYVYRREYLLKFTKLPQTRSSNLEFEQLRAWNGANIRVVDEGKSIGVDTRRSEQ